MRAHESPAQTSRPMRCSGANGLRVMSQTCHVTEIYFAARSVLAVASAPHHLAHCGFDACLAGGSTSLSGGGANGTGTPGLTNRPGAHLTASNRNGRYNGHTSARLDRSSPMRPRTLVHAGSFRSPLTRVFDLRQFPREIEYLHFPAFISGDFSMPKPKDPKRKLDELVPPPTQVSVGITGPEDEVAKIIEELKQKAVKDIGLWKKQ